MSDKIKLSDFVADFLASKGVRYIHMVVGGGAASLNDSFGKHPNLQYISYHSEAIGSYSAFGESKYTNKPSILNVTSGIGGVAALPGVLSAWDDSVPMLIISGNVNFNQTARYYKLHKNLNLKQVGIQDNDIIEIVKNITKYAVTLEKAEDILYELEKCWYLSTEGRPSPVWLEVPANLANSLIIPEELKHFNQRNIDIKMPFNIDDIIKLQNIQSDIISYQRPLILAGGGIRQSNSVKGFNQFINKYQIPFVNTFLGCDLTDYDNPLNLGTIGVKAKRNANFSLNNADFLLILGCQLNICHIGYLPDQFAPKARKIAIDIDSDVHKKGIIKLDEVINCDLKDFFNYVNN